MWKNNLEYLNTDITFQLIAKQIQTKQIYGHIPFEEMTPGIMAAGKPSSDWGVSLNVVWRYQRL